MDITKNVKYDLLDTWLAHIAAGHALSQACEKGYGEKSKAFIDLEDEYHKGHSEVVNHHGGMIKSELDLCVKVAFFFAAVDETTMANKTAKLNIMRYAHKQIIDAIAARDFSRKTPLKGKYL